MEHRKGCLPQDLLRLRQRVPPRCIGCAPTPVLKPDKKPDPEQGHALAAAKAAAAKAAAAKAGGCYRQQRAERQQCRRRRHVRTAEHLPRTSSARAQAALPRLRRALALHSDAWRMRAHRCQQCCTWRCRTSLDAPHAAAREVTPRAHSQMHRIAQHCRVAMGVRCDCRLEGSYRGQSRSCRRCGRRCAAALRRLASLTTLTTSRRLRPRRHSLPETTARFPRVDG